MNFRSNKVTDIREYYDSLLQQNFSHKESLIQLDMILEEYFGISKTKRVLNSGLRLSESEILKIHFAVKQLLNNKPIQYVLNKCYFHGLSFFVDERVLIPRPETEEMVGMILNNSKLGHSNTRVLDIGTGSGCVAVTLKHSFPGVSVWAMDVSEEALDVARKNALDLHVNVNFINDDILSPLKTDQLPLFDVIVSNPPYVRLSETTTMKPNVLDYEPALALFVPDDDPLIFYRKIILFSQVKLLQGGFLYFEINRDFADQTMELLCSNGFGNVEVHKDFNGNSRFVVANKL